MRVIAKICEPYREWTSHDFAGNSDLVTQQPLTPVGELLEAARGGMSKRQAAKAARISEGRWRQIVSGRQSAGGVQIPVNPKRETIIAMAQAVGADVQAALTAAGFDEPYKPPSHVDDPLAATGESVVESLLLREMRAMREAQDEMNRRLANLERLRRGDP